MRPVLLEMHGFGSFREPTTVDFVGAEYFALVGPTGAGKSTVIDAITFALYGSVPRWDNARTVALALAPTVNRGTVRYVFDVVDQRYVVARELRRAASGGVSVRGARLERLRDSSGVGGPEEDTEPIADGAGPVTRAVEELLGLPFGDFCSCVVLPQGEFAEFLHTEPRKRQEKLVRILGLGVYDVVAREANTEASRQRQRAEVLADQLGGYADATAEAEQAARERVGALEALVERAGAAVPELAAADAAVAEAAATVARLRDERDRLRGLAVPAGVADVDARRRAALAAAESAAARTAAAEHADTAARERLAAAPARGPLEQVRRQHRELRGLTAELPVAEERHAKVRAAYEAAAAEAGTAHAAVDAARGHRDTAAASLAAARDAATRIAAERAALAAPAVPAGLDALGQRRSRAAAALREAETERASAEEADTAARAALAAAPDRAPLERARRDHHDLAAAVRERAGAEGRVTAARAAVAASAGRLAEARHRVGHAQERRTEALRSDLVAALRPTLVAGDPCPVCRQVLPGDAVGTGPAAAADLDAADQALTAAEAEHERARAAESAATAEVAAAAAELDRVGAVIDRLTAALADAPATPEAVDRSLAELDRLAAAATSADAAARAARRRRDEVAAAGDAVRAQAQAAASQLRAARDPLVALGAPAVDTDDVSAGWTALVEWAHAEATARGAALATARDAAAAAERVAEARERDLHEAERSAHQRRREETTAARAEQEASSAVQGLRARAEELRAVLVGAPTDAQAATELERVAELEGAAREADAELRAARAGLRQADAGAAAVDREAAAAWAALRSARDPLVPLGAPAVADGAGGDLLAAWTALTGWAAAEAAARADRSTAAATAVSGAEAVRAAAERRLGDDLAAHGVTAAPPLARSALPAAVAAAERARGARDRIVERREQAGKLVAERNDAEGAQQVAHMLGRLLRSDGFPRWLVASALDALVADASVSLAELSSGQFELTHADGDFLVIDHADADARRPVKTLSGGETFQASLALALALSAQMSGLAAQGAARLESIFLDEGFGTLDEANLDVVASTLEALATRGDRVVGVITHVPALAERVPVRFAVSRDQRTSSVVREGA
jgi:DNA repair protein SbcC/Rad50